jgi:single-strand DNA-binding protein
VSAATAALRWLAGRRPNRIFPRVRIEGPSFSILEAHVSRSLNKVTLIGNLGADPEVRSTSNGSRVATLSLATSRRWKNQSGEQQEKTEWHRVILWNNKGSTLADLAERYMKKGDKLYVEGSIEYRSWQDREGQTRYTTEITAREVILLSGKGEGAESFTPANKVAAAAAGSAPKGKDQSFEDFPEALDSEDDDLPF